MPLQLEPLPEPIRKALAEEKNTEDIFLKASSMTLLYEKAGTMHEKVTFLLRLFLKQKRLSIVPKTFMLSGKAF
jgi:hypothetical protein